MARKNPRRRAQQNPAAPQKIPQAMMGPNGQIRMLPGHVPNPMAKPVFIGSDRPTNIEAKIDSGKVLVNFGHKLERLWLTPEEAISVGLGLFQLGRKIKPEVAAGVLEKVMQTPVQRTIWTPGSD
jgi:hypothetical protein